MRLFNSEAARAIFCMTGSMAEIADQSTCADFSGGGHLVYTTAGGSRPIENGIVVHLESEAAAYEYLGMLRATLMPSRVPAAGLG